MKRKTDTLLLILVAAGIAYAVYTTFVVAPRRFAEPPAGQSDGL